MAGRLPARRRLPLGENAYPATADAFVRDGKQECLPYNDGTTWISGIGKPGLHDYETTGAVNRESGIQYRTRNPTSNTEKLRTENG
jgi:hypothetical protein